MEREWWTAEAVEEGMHVVEVAAELLRVANATPGETSADFRDASLEAKRKHLQRGLIALLSRSRSEFLDGDELRVFAEALDQSSLRTGISALIAAKVLDAQLGHRFIDYFQLGVQRLRPGDPVPTVPFPSTSLSSEQRENLLKALGSRTSNPATLTPLDDRTPRLRLAPDGVTRFRVSLRWVDPHLQVIDDRYRFAGSVLNQSVAGEFEWQRYDVAEKPVFYGVAPRDSAAQLARLHAAITEAVARQASVLVLPELCLTEEMAAQVGESEAAKLLPLLVLGSYHEPCAGPGYNRCRVLARGVEISRHDKFSDFHFVDDDVTRHEHLLADEHRAGFDLLVGANATAVVLICKDAMDARVQEIVRALAPNLVCVPAMSPKTHSFETFACQLANDPQAFTLVCSTQGEHEVILGRPVVPNSLTTLQCLPKPCIVVGLNGCEVI